MRHSTSQGPFLLPLLVLTTLFQSHHDVYYKRLLVGPLPLEITREADARLEPIRVMEVCHVMVVTWCHTRFS